MTNTHPSFEWLRSKTIDSLNISITEYQHRVTGAKHIHISADNNENVFLVALRTVPQDSTGVAHILEHTALCGSKKYPLRDPFFMMIRRSLNTFMNAMTSSDWTAYPFASQNKKDFDNLLDVYLDAVFFSRLDPLDFAQEGHRLDFTEAGNIDSPLIYKGVVYNEMKGAMSPTISKLWQALNKHIFPTSTYHYNSGGEPKDIPNLSYEQLKQFYKTHYHPSNATFMSFGDIPAVELQERFETLALQHFEKLDEVIQVYPEQRLSAPIRVEESYPYIATEGDDIDKKSHIVIAWLLDESINLKSNLEVNLLSNLLYDNSASPLRHLLETSNLGTSPSLLCGENDSMYEMLFVCGLEGCAKNNAAALENNITALLEDLVTNGLPQTQIEASLHQLELQQREIGGDGYPHGLQIIMNALSPATHRGDIISFMDLESALQSLRNEIKDRNYIPQLIQRLLLNNTHRVTLTLTPDEKLFEQQKSEEKMELAAKKAAMSNNEKQAIIKQSQALDERQQQQENIEILPKVGLEDIPQSSPLLKGIQQNIGGDNNRHFLTDFAVGTNGLCYQQIVCPLPKLSEEELTLLPYYVLCLTEVGIADNDYLMVQQRQSEVVGNISAYYSLRNHTDQVNEYCAHITLSAKALSSNQEAMSKLMQDTLLYVNFDDANRIKELIAQEKAERDQSITDNGHGYAMQAASATLNPIAETIQKLMGLESIQTIKAYNQQLQNDDNGTFIDTLNRIHHKVLQAPKHIVLITEAKMLEQQKIMIQQTFNTLLQVSTQQSLLTLPQTTKNKVYQAWITNSQVNFCAKAYPTVPMNHPDAPVLTVLGGILRNGFLHRVIREQGGAYGGGASQDNTTASFRFYSYRDPRFTETLADFDSSIKWLLEKNITDLQIEESILSVIGSLDKPSSPAGEAKKSFHLKLAGLTDDCRSLFRRRIIDVKADDLYRVAEQYLIADNANIAVVTGNHGREEAKTLGLELVYV